MPLCPAVCRDSQSIESRYSTVWLCCGWCACLCACLCAGQSMSTGTTTSPVSVGRVWALCLCTWAGRSQYSTYRVLTEEWRTVILGSGSSLTSTARLSSSGRWDPAAVTRTICSLGGEAPCTQYRVHEECFQILIPGPGLWQVSEILWRYWSSYRGLQYRRVPSSHGLWLLSLCLEVLCPCHPLQLHWNIITILMVLYNTNIGSILVYVKLYIGLWSQYW